MNTNFPKQNEPLSGNAAGEASRISEGTIFKGEIQSPYDVRIDGTMEGKVISQSKVFVGEKAVVKGDIICNNCDFSGKIEGNFYVKDTLSLNGTCIVDGDLHVKRLQVELDAKFNGSCHMITEEDFSRLTSGKPASQAEPAKPMQSASVQQSKPSAQTSQPGQQRFSQAHPFGEPKKQNFPEA